VCRSAVPQCVKVLLSAGLFMTVSMTCQRKLLNVVVSLFPEYSYLS